MNASGRGVGSRGLVLTGLPGSGASSVARLLAARHGLVVRDSDRDVEHRLGAEVADIFLNGGEAAFRDAERTVVLAALAGLAPAVPSTATSTAPSTATPAAPAPAATPVPAVVVVGGGALADDEVATALRQVTAAGVPLVFLDVLLPDAARRLGWQTHAVPAGLGSPRATWQRLADERRARCRELATLVLATDGSTVAQVADLLEAQLEEMT